MPGPSMTVRKDALKRSIGRIEVLMPTSPSPSDVAWRHLTSCSVGKGSYIKVQTLNLKASIYYGENWSWAGLCCPFSKTLPQ